MTKLLSKDDVAAYRDRGYHFPVDALSANEVAGFRRKLEDYEAESGGPYQGPRCAIAAMCCSAGSTR